MTRGKRDVNLVTKIGLEKLKEELELRSTTKKKKLIDTLDKMRQMGDLSENDGYTLAIRDLEANEYEIQRLKELISKAKVAQNGTAGVVELGDTVLLKDSEGKESKCTLVGEDEVDVLNGKISYKSPLGTSIVGKKKGDSFKFKTPRGEVRYEVISIND